MNQIWHNDSPPHSLNIKYNVALGPLTWIKSGGNAECFIKINTVEDLSECLKCLKDNVPFNILGAGSNILVRDQGLDGLTVKLGKGFRAITYHDNSTVTAGGAVLLPDLALGCARNGLTNLEFLVGIPGTVGGALKMNAGAHNQVVGDVLASCVTVDRQGNICKWQGQDIVFSNRSSSLPKDHVIISATFHIQDEAHDLCKQRIKDLTEYRLKTQPQNVATCGCAFKNPIGHQAWSLVESSGVDLYAGQAQFSKKHHNFLINQGRASAEELEALLNQVEKAVFEKTGIILEKEVHIIGKR